MYVQEVTNKNVMVFIDLELFLKVQRSVLSFSFGFERNLLNNSNENYPAKFMIREKKQGRVLQFQYHKYL